MITRELYQKIEFFSEIEKLKIIYRQNGVLGNQRKENSAEHSWHIAIMAILLADHSLYKNLDILKVLKMLLIHDIVEIDAGDTFLYNDIARKDAHEIENKAAQRIFGLLPQLFRDEFMELWLEFEQKDTNEAKYANSIDGFQPLLNHYITRNENDNLFDVSRTKVIAKKEFIKEASPDLWEMGLEIIDKSVLKGIYLPN
jgi:putative hydrolases of HD superfamily